MVRSNKANLQPTLGWRVISSILRVDRIHRIQGGLANQMFQYAHAWALAEKFPARILVDLSRYKVAPPDRPYSIEQVFLMSDRFPKLDSKLGRLIKTFGIDRANLIEEESLEYKPKFITNDLRGVVQGYFPLFKYSSGIEDKLRRNFAFRRDLPTSAKTLATELDGPDSTFVHIRRGDYLSPENRNTFYGMCSPAYYRAAMRIILSRYPSSKFYFFSDDPAWCRSMFGAEATRFVEGNVGSDAWVDMELMSRCRHAIIANSSFSLWARWLSRRRQGNISIGPSQFLNGNAFGARTEEIIPTDFLRLTNFGTVDWAGDTLII